ncbi:MAG: hypothetical protein ACYTEQ_25265 [Planctomycetota bacterium]|jgi:hypothetical protein
MKPTFPDYYECTAPDNPKRHRQLSLAPLAADQPGDIGDLAYRRVAIPIKTKLLNYLSKELLRATTMMDNFEPDVVVIPTQAAKAHVRWFHQFYTGYQPPNWKPLLGLQYRESNHTLRVGYSDYELDTEWVYLNRDTVFAEFVEP